MHFVRNNSYVKTFTSIGIFFSIFFLSGCNEWITPVDAEQTFVVTKGHNIQVSYTGIFTNYCTELTALMAFKSAENDKKTMTPQQCSQAITNRIEKVFSDHHAIGSIKSINTSQYQIEYQATLSQEETVFDGGLACIRNGSYCDQLRIASFADIRAGKTDFKLFGDEEVYRELRGATQPQKEGENPKEVFEQFKKIQEKAALFRMRLVVQTDLYVTSHNASSVKAMENGLTEYRWELIEKSPRPLLNAVHDEVLGKEIALQEKLSTHGLRCRDIIDSGCKCGPFKLVDTKGQPIKNQPYEMRVSGRSVNGVTAKDGSIKAVLTETTGECSVKIKERKR